MLPPLLHPTETYEETAQLVDEYAETPYEGASWRADGLAGFLLDRIGRTSAFVDACHRRVEGPSVSTTSRSFMVSTRDNPVTGRQIHLDVEQLTSNLELYRRVVQWRSESAELSALCDRMRPLCRDFDPAGASERWRRRHGRRAASPEEPHHHDP
jgi:hypothetical protein